MSKQLLFILLLVHTNVLPNQNPLFNLDTNTLRIINGVGVLAAAANTWNMCTTAKEDRAAVAAIAFGILAAPHIATIIWPEPQSSIQNHNSTHTRTKNSNSSLIHIGDHVENGSITNSNVTTYYVVSYVLLAHYGLKLSTEENNAILKILNCIPILAIGINLLHYSLKSIHACSKSNKSTHS